MDIATYWSLNKLLALFSALSILDAEYSCPYTERLRYAWDPAKAEAHLAAHGVRFAEAVTVLEDDCALTHADPDSEGEQRVVTLGMRSVAPVLVVVYTDREPEVIRIIAAWRANRRHRVR